MTALEASCEALIIAQVKAGESPVPEPMKQAGDPTVSELAMRYLTEYVEVWCKPRTVKTDRSVVHKHIAPTLGKLPLTAVERAQVAKLRERLCATPAAANQAVRTLSAIYRLAEGWGFVPEGMNPCRSIMKYPGRRRERFLTEAGIRALGMRPRRGGGEGRRVGAPQLRIIDVFIKFSPDYARLPWRLLPISPAPREADGHLEEASTGFIPLELTSRGETAPRPVRPGAGADVRD